MPYLLEKSRFGINFLAKRNTILLLYMYQVFIFLQDHLNSFLHFFFTFMQQLFLDDPISPSIWLQRWFAPRRKSGDDLWWRYIDPKKWHKDSKWTRYFQEHPMSEKCHKCRDQEANNRRKPGQDHKMRFLWLIMLIWSCIINETTGEFSYLEHGGKGHYEKPNKEVGKRQRNNQIVGHVPEEAIWTLFWSYKSPSCRHQSLHVRLWSLRSICSWHEIARIWCWGGMEKKSVALTSVC